MKNKRNIAWGCVFILAAVYILLYHMGWLLIDIALFPLIVSILLICLSVQGIIKRNFYQILLPLAFVYWLNYETIPADWTITRVNGWAMCIVALCLAVGLSLIFPKKKENQNPYVVDANIHADYQAGNGHVGSNGDGLVKIANCFTSSTKYVNAVTFQKTEVANSFGRLVVYFNNARIQGAAAQAKVDNSFGEICLYVPGNWRVHVQQNSVFGNIDFVGNPNADADAQLLDLTMNNSFGHIIVYYV